MRGAVAYDAAFVGIYSGGAWLAERLPALVPGNHPVGFIDVSFYRDDYSTHRAEGRQPAHGRCRSTSTARRSCWSTTCSTPGAACAPRSTSCSTSAGPARIELAVLIDRGGRELPIEPTYCGARLTVARDLSIVLSRDADRLELAVERQQA